MKKLAIAGASVALAAMPAVGVFAAATQQTSVQDYVKLTVNDSCSMMADPSHTTSGAAINLGSGAVSSGRGPQDGTTMTISCNTAAGFTLTAEATALANGSNPAINFGPYAETGGSVWSAMIEVTGDDAANASIATNWNNWASPATAQTTSGGVQILSSVANTGVAGIEVTPSYKAYVGANQPAGDYTGSITYTFGGTIGS